MLHWQKLLPNVTEIIKMLFCWSFSGSGTWMTCGNFQYRVMFISGRPLVTDGLRSPRVS